MGPSLRANLALARAIAELEGQQQMQEVPSPEPEPEGGEHPAVGAIPAHVSSLNEMGEIFAQLDPMRELLAQCLDGWQVPQLVVVGNENAGKSTLLERLCMMPIFPHDEDICTRMRIQVRLRRGAAQAPRLEVFNLRTKKREGAVKTVPTETANVDVREAMGRLLSQQQRCITGVTADHMLILHVQSPNVPTLDLVDLPGIMAIAASDEPADMP
jgi:hypothetical protein